MLDVLLHAIGGAAFVLAASLFGSTAGLGAVLFALGFGFGREAYQHWDDWPVFNLHRVIEALAWPVGGALAWLLVRLMQS